MPVAEEHAGGGPVYFAWADPDEVVFGYVHERYDEYILKLEIDLEEGKIPEATLDMINPGVSWWLAPDRQRWAWIAFATADGIVPKFFGRIVALPSDMFGEVVTVKFYAKPLDYLARKQATAETLKADPQYYDRVLIDPKFWDDPDTILEARSANWHHDPVSHDITISDYINGEDGEEEFAASEIIYDSLAFVLGDPPPRAVNVDAIVTHTQRAAGSIDLGVRTFNSLTGQGLYQGWPKPGDSIGAGWTVKRGSATDGGVTNAYVQEFKFEFKNADKVHNNGDAMSVNETLSKPSMAGLITDHKLSSSITVGDEETGRAAALSVQESATWILPWTIRGELEIEYAAARDRTEHLMFTLALDAQPMLTDSDGTDDIETLTLTGADVGQPLGPGGEIPIGDVSRRSYFPIARGLRSVVYVLNVARAHLLSTARPAEVTFSPVSFDRALALTCRKTARVHDARRLPGGEAAGKIVNVKISADGASGQFLGVAMLKGAIGHGGAIEVVDGTPTIADADTLGPDVQLFAGEARVLATGDCGYSIPVDGVNDDGLVFPLTYGQVVVRDETIIGAESQEDVVHSVSGLGGDTSGGTGFGALLPGAAVFDVAAQAEAVSTAVATALAARANKHYELELKPVADLSFEYSFDLTAGPLLVPAQVNLAGS